MYVLLKCMIASGYAGGRLEDTSGVLRHGLCGCAQVYSCSSFFVIVERSSGKVDGRFIDHDSLLSMNVQASSRVLLVGCEVSSVQQCILRQPHVSGKQLAIVLNAISFRMLSMRSLSVLTARRSADSSCRRSRRQERMTGGLSLALWFRHAPRRATW